MSPEHNGQRNQGPPFEIESDDVVAAREAVRESRQRIDEDLEALSQRLREARRDMRRTTTMVMGIAGLPMRALRWNPALVVALVAALGLLAGVRRVRRSRRRIHTAHRIRGNGRPSRWVLLGIAPAKRA